MNRETKEYRVAGLGASRPMKLGKACAVAGLSFRNAVQRQRTRAIESKPAYFRWPRNNFRANPPKPANASVVGSGTSAMVY